MCKRQRNSVWLAAGAVSLGLVAPAAAAPMILGPLYEEPTRNDSHPAPPDAGGCTVQIVELGDARRAPEALGVMVGFKAIQSPSDRAAWLRSVFEVGLAARGFKPVFSPAEAPVQGAVTARIRMKAVWITTQGMNKVGSLAVFMSAAAPGAALGPEKIYRGDDQSLNFAGSRGEFNGLANRLFADAMDAMSEDLRPLCPGAAATTAAARG